MTVEMYQHQRHAQMLLKMAEVTQMSIKTPRPKPPPRPRMRPLALRIGQVMGLWTVLTAGQRRGTAHRAQFYVTVRCQCGREKMVRESALQTGQSRSCGCTKGKYGDRGMPVGATVGQWAVIQTGLRIGKNPAAMARCRCGRARLFRYDKLRRNPPCECRNATVHSERKEA